MDEDIWSTLDTLKFPEDGTGPPAMEMEQEEEEEVKGLLWEVTTKIYIWSDLDSHKYQLNSSQTMVPLGELTLAEAQKRMSRRNRRKGT